MPEDPDNELPQTPLEESRSQFGQRYYSIKKGFMHGWVTSINAKKGRPSGQGTLTPTLTEVPLEANAEESADGTVYLVAYPCFLWEDGDEEVFDADHPNIIELTHDEFYALKSS